LFVYHRKLCIISTAFEQRNAHICCVSMYLATQTGQKGSDGDSGRLGPRGEKGEKGNPAVDGDRGEKGATLLVVVVHVCILV